MPGLYHKLHGHHRPVQMKKAEIKRRKRVVPNNMVNDDQSSIYTAETAEDDRRSIPPHNEAPSPTSFSNQPESKVQIRLAGGPIPVDFTDTFRAQRLTPNNNNNNESSRPSPQNPRKRSFSAAAGEEGEEHNASGPYPHAQNMVSPGNNNNNNDNIDPSLPARNREPSAEPPRQVGGTTTNSSSDKDARRAALEAESEKMLLMLQENRRKLEALRNEE
jgi:GATA-binding protein